MQRENPRERKAQIKTELESEHRAPEEGDRGPGRRWTGRQQGGGKAEERGHRMLGEVARHDPRAAENEKGLQRGRGDRRPSPGSDQTEQTGGRNKAA